MSKTLTYDELKKALAVAESEATQQKKNTQFSDRELVTVLKSKFKDIPKGEFRVITRNHLRDLILNEGGEK